MSRIVVFAGPTLSSQQVNELVPGADVRPPIAAGDLLQLSLVAGDVAAIIDGFYFQSGAVRHKEILAALNKGIHVWGAASMGALRAAELAPFGMRGFGRIFQAYLNGEIEGDDEVAILHSPEDMGYVNLTEALVNIRYACDCAVHSDMLTASESAMLIDIASALPFHERSYALLLSRAREQGLPEERVVAFQQFVQQQQVDLKLKDALELLQALQKFPSDTQPCVPFTMYETKFLRDWQVFSRGTPIGKEMFVPDIDILTVCQLFSDDYPRLHARLQLKTLAEIAGRVLPPNSPDQAQENGLDALLINKATEPLEELAVTQLIARYIAQQCSVSLDEDQKLPAALLNWLRPAEQAFPRIQQLALIGLRLWQEPRSYSWHRVELEHIKASPAFSGLVKIVVQSRVFNETLQEQFREMELQRLPAAQIYEYFLQRWNIKAEDARLALLERGFRGPTDLIERARPFYLLDRYSGIPKFSLDAD